MSVFVLLSFLGLCFALKRYSALDIVETPFFVIFLVVSSLYFFAYVGCLPQSAAFLFVLGLVMLVYLGIHLSQNHALVLTEYFTPGFSVFLVLGGIFCLFAFFGSLHGWDEFSHWGPHSKIMAINHGFEKAEDFLNHKSYPPGSRLLHYFFYQLGGFYEGKAYIAQTLFVLCPMAVLLKGFSWPNWRRPFLIFAFGALLLIFFRVGIAPYVSLYIDAPVAMFVSMGFAYYMLSDKSPKAILWLTPVAFGLALFKIKLMALVLLMSGLIAVDQCLHAFFVWQAFRARYKRKPFKDCVIGNLNHIAKIVLAIASLPVVAKISIFSWLCYMHSINVPLELQAAYGVTDILHVFSSTASDSAKLTMMHFKQALYEQLTMIVMLCVLPVLAYLPMKRDRAAFSWLLANVAMLFGLIAYLFGMFLIYMFVYDGVDGAFIGTQLVSFARYLSLYYLTWSMVIYATFVFAFSRFNKAWVERSLIAVILIVASLCLLNHFRQYERKLAEHRIQLPADIKLITDRVNALTSPHSKIFTVWQSSRGFEARVIRYNLVPREFSSANGSFGPKYERGDVWTKDISKSDFAKSISSYGYLLVGRADKRFWARYGSLFPTTFKPLVRYPYCVGRAFDSSSTKGCALTEELAYLFKIQTVDGKLSLQNIV